MYCKPTIGCLTHSRSFECVGVGIAASGRTPRLLSSHFSRTAITDSPPQPAYTFPECSIEKCACLPRRPEVVGCSLIIVLEAASLSSRVAEISHFGRG